MGKYLALVACLLMAFSCSENEKIEWVATTSDLPWDSRGSAYVSPEEEDAAIAAGALPLTMGARVLRTETAALAALSILQAHWD